MMQTKQPIAESGLQVVLKRFPSFVEILPAFSVVAVMAYGWNLVHFLWKVPSWLLFLTLGDVLSLLAYALTAALAESLVIVAVLLAACFLLPEKYFKHDFVVRAVWLALVGYGGMMILLTVNATHGDLTARYWDLLSASIAILAVLAAYASVRVSWMRRSALWLSDQLIVFLFILVPASLVSLIVVIFRNLT